MTLEYYLSPAAFPLTTRAGASAREQIQRDIADFDAYARAVRCRVPLTDHQRAAGRELTTKHIALAAVLWLIEEQEEREAAQDAIGPSGPSPA